MSDFELACEAYDAAGAALMELIDNPVKTVPVSEYRAMIKRAQDAKHAAWLHMMDCWQFAA